MGVQFPRVIGGEWQRGCRRDLLLASVASHPSGIYRPIFYTICDGTAHTINVIRASNFACALCARQHSTSINSTIYIT